MMISLAIQFPYGLDFSFVELLSIVILASLITLVVGILIRPFLERFWKPSRKSQFEDLLPDDEKTSSLYSKSTEAKSQPLKPEPTTKKVVEKELNQATQQLQQEVENLKNETNFIIFESEYRLQLINQYETIDFWGTANHQPIALHREDFFVLPQFSVEVPQERILAMGDLLKNFRHIILVGPSGVGKTETIYYLLLTYARQKEMTRLGLNKNLIPVFFRAFQMVQHLTSSKNGEESNEEDPDLTLPDLLEEKLEVPFDKFVENRLEKGHFIILVDGFNTISYPQTKQTIHWLEKQAKKYSNNRFLVAVRPDFLDCFHPDGPFTEAHFAKLEDMKKFAKNWGLLIPNTEKTLKVISGEEQIYNLAHIPFQLLMLLVVGAVANTLPSHKVQLYATYLNLLLTSHNDYEPDHPLFQLSERDKLSVMQRIAFTLHRNHQINVEEEELNHIMSQALEEIENASEEIESSHLVEFAQQSGLLIKWKKGYYRFSQLGLQEFLTAQAQNMAKDGLGQILTENKDNPWWREVHSFYKDLINPTRVVDQTFTQHTKDLMAINTDQIYALSLLGRTLEKAEAAAIAAEERVSQDKESATPIFDTESMEFDPDVESKKEEKAIKILVVDDTAANLQLTRFILQREKYKVVEAKNGKEGLKAVHNEKPSLILSDIQMPGMDGYEFCRRLKADKQTRNIPFIFITAFSRTTKEAAQGLELGADDYITRPFGPEELLARISANVRIHKAEEAARKRAISLARKNRELALLNQIQKSVTASLNLDRVLDATIEQIQKLLQADETSLWFVDQENNALLLGATFNEGEQSPYGTRQPLQESISGYAARSGEPFLASDLKDDPYYQTLNTEEELSSVRSMIAVPLRVRKQVIGILQTVHHESNHFDQDDLDLLVAVADAVTVAIENAWLFGQIQLFNQQLDQKVKARTRQLAQEKDKTETILVSIADSLLVTDPNNKIMLANRAAEEMLDFNLDEVMGHSIDQSEFNTPLWEFVRHINAQPSPVYTATTEITDPEDPDHLLSFQAHSAKMWDKTQQTYMGTVIVLRDITALQEVERLKARFMTGVTHELKTPLAIVALHLGILLKYNQSLDETKRLERLQTIRRQTLLLEGLVENILEFSKLDGGILQLKQTVINLVSLSQQITEELEPLAQEKELDLEITNTQSTINVYADKKQLERVIRNLIDNAIKYTPKGKISVSVQTTDKEPAKQQALLKISDTGIGLTKEQISKLFERFYRADPSHNIPGTGLGLSIAREIVNLHQGDIQVESKVGKGSTFIVILPLHK